MNLILNDTLSCFINKIISITVNRKQKLPYCSILVQDLLERYEPQVKVYVYPITSACVKSYQSLGAGLLMEKMNKKVHLIVSKEGASPLQMVVCHLGCWQKYSRSRLSFGITSGTFKEGAFRILYCVRIGGE